MRDLDRMIDEALGAEESELLRRMSGEPDLLERALGMFGAGVRWMAWLMMAIQTLLFVAGVWAAWTFFEAGDPVTQLRWGLPAAVLLLMSLMIKLAVAPTLHADRLMRELKRIELQIARGHLILSVRSGSVVLARDSLSGESVGLPDIVPDRNIELTALGAPFSRSWPSLV